MSYQVERHEHGIVVMGPLPVGDMAALCKVWFEEGLDIADGVISQHLGAALVVTNAEGSRIWRQQLGLADPDLNDGKGCPGAGKCHGSLCWCQRCGDVEHTCDEPDLCDLHKQRRVEQPWRYETAKNLHGSLPPTNAGLCPGCGEPTDNGHDREYPPNPYLCSKCEGAADDPT